MGNILDDFTGVAYVQPYVGVGGGYQWAQERNLFVSSGSGVAAAPTNNKGRFAYQAILGAALPVGGGLALTADYRFMGLTGDRNYAATLSDGTHASFKLNDNYNHTVLVGFRLAFGAPAPAPETPAAAVPPSPVSRSYLVFFDWDKATLTDRARQIVSEAAANSHQGPVHPA